jgi:signal transduction histidine kinase
VAAPATFEEWTRLFVVRRLRILGWIAIGVLGAYLSRDVLQFGWYSEAVAYRLGALFAAGTLLAFHKTSFVRRFADLGLIVAACAVTISSLAVAAVQPPSAVSSLSSSYFVSTNGLILIFLVLALTVPAHWYTHVIIQATAVGYFYLSSPHLFEAVAAEGQLSGSLFNLFWVCAFCDASVFLYARLQRSEFHARRDLAGANSELASTNVQLQDLSGRRKLYVDSLVRIGISATASDPDHQARSALDEMIRLVGASRAYLYLLGVGGELQFQAGRDAKGRDLAPPVSGAAPGGYTLISVPLRMRERSIGAIRFEKQEPSGGFSAADEDFLRALASHVAIALETLRTTEELRQARDRALEAGRVKDAFLQTMGHELRTPLNAIIGYSEMMLEDLTDQEQAAQVSDVRRIHDSAGHLLSILSDILELTKIEADRLSAKVESFPVAELAAEIEATVRPRAARNRNRLDFVIDEKVGCMSSDRARVGQALLKLLDNASGIRWGRSSSPSIRPMPPRPGRTEARASA